MVLAQEVSSHESSHEGFVSHRSAVHGRDPRDHSDLTANNAAWCRAERRSGAGADLRAVPPLLPTGLPPWLLRWLLRCSLLWRLWLWRLWLWRLRWLLRRLRLPALLRRLWRLRRLLQPVVV